MSSISICTIWCHDRKISLAISLLARHKVFSFFAFVSSLYFSGRYWSSPGLHIIIIIAECPLSRMKSGSGVQCPACLSDQARRNILQKNKLKFNKKSVEILRPVPGYGGRPLLQALSSPRPARKVKLRNNYILRRHSKLRKSPYNSSLIYNVSFWLEELCFLRY